MNDLIHKIVGVIIEAGQSDTKKFRLGETIRYSPSEIMEILKQHESEIFGVDVINLKPCPFCGGDAEISHGRFDGKDTSYVMCKKCAAQGEFFFVSPKYASDERAIKAWNRRAE